MPALRVLERRAVGVASRTFLGCGSSGKRPSATTTGGGFTVALVSDIGKFNDRSSNQSQLEVTVPATL